MRDEKPSLKLVPAALPYGLVLLNQAHDFVNKCCELALRCGIKADACPTAHQMDEGLTGISFYPLKNRSSDGGRCSGFTLHVLYGFSKGRFRWGLECQRIIAGWEIKRPDDFNFWMYMAPHHMDEEEPRIWQMEIQDKESRAAMKRVRKDFGFPLVDIGLTSSFVDEAAAWATIEAIFTSARKFVKS